MFLLISVAGPPIIYIPDKKGKFIFFSLFRFMWVDKVGPGVSYFIIIATNMEDGWGRGKPVLAWAMKKKRNLSLKVSGSFIF